MAENRMLESKIGERSFGSAFDPVLCGVAQGLARVFPPIETAYPGEAAEPPSRDEQPRDREQVARHSGLAEENTRA